MTHPLFGLRALILAPILLLLAACADPAGPIVPWTDPSLDRTPQPRVTILYQDWEEDRPAIFEIVEDTCPEETELLWIIPGRFLGTVQHPHKMTVRCLTQEQFTTASRSPSIRDALILDWPQN